MAKNSKKLKKKIRRQFKNLFKGSSFSGNMLSGMLAALVMEWWQNRQGQKKTQKALPPADASVA